MNDLDARAIDLGPLRLERAVEIKRDLPILAQERQRLSFKDAEIGGVAQVIVLPGERCLTGVLQTQPPCRFALYPWRCLSYLHSAQPLV